MRRRAKKITAAVITFLLTAQLSFPSAATEAGQSRLHDGMIPAGEAAASAEDLTGQYEDAGDGVFSSGRGRGGLIPAPADLEVISFTEDPDYDPGSVMTGADPEILYEVGETASYPASYKNSSSVLSALKKVMPNTRDQGDYGFCWCFGTLAAVEGNLINRQGYSASGVDLSELHLGYYASNYSLDNGGGSKDTVKNPDYSKQDGEGGHPYIALGALSNRAGAVKESVMPYSGAASSKKGKVAASQDQCDFSITDWQMYDLSNENDWPYAKAAIRAGGALIFDVNMENDNGYDSSHNSYYSSGTQADHTVAVVGWDDDFPKSYFSGNVKGNGAWLLRNSWTTSTGMNENSYFYVSYYNPVNYSSGGDGHAAYAISAVDSSKDYKYIYQYDGAIASWGEAKTQSSEQQGANVFTARGDEEIKAVSFQTGTSTVNADYEVRVYTGLQSGTKDPTGGTLAATATGKTSAVGLYRVVLDSPVGVQSGSVFSVVVSLKKSSGTPCIAAESRKSEVSDYIDQSVAVNRGQSFVRAGSSGSWKDMADDKNYGNLRIKAFSDDGDGQPHPVTGVSLPETAKVTVGKTITLTPVISPSNATNRKVSWRSDNETVATVSTSGVVKGMVTGSANILVKTEDGGYEASCKVLVEEQSGPVDPDPIDPDPVDPGDGDMIPLTPDSFDQNVSLIPGEVKRLSVSSSGEFIYGVRWKIEDGGTKGCVTLKNGVVTAKKPGSALITATYGTSETVKFNVTVEAPPSLIQDEKCNVRAPKSINMKPDDGKKTVVVSVPLDKDVDWEILNPDVCELDEGEWDKSETKISVGVTPKTPGATWIIWSFYEYYGDEHDDGYWDYAEREDPGMGALRHARARGGNDDWGDDDWDDDDWDDGWDDGYDDEPVYQLCTKVVVTGNSAPELNVMEPSMVLSVGQGRRIRVTGLNDCTNPGNPSFRVKGKGIRVSKAGYVVGVVPGSKGTVTVRFGKMTCTVDVSVSSFTGDYLSVGKISAGTKIPKKDSAKPKKVAFKLKKKKGLTVDMKWSITGASGDLYIDESTGVVSVTGNAKPGCYIVTGRPLGEDNRYNTVYSELILN